MTQANEIQIDFGSIVGGPEQAPTGSADAALARVVSSGGSKELVCTDLLSAAQWEQAKTLATQLLPTMLANTDQLATFGTTAIDQVNAQVNRIFREVGPVNIPELTQIMHEVNDRMREFRRKYDRRDPKVREAFDRFTDAIKGLFRRGRDMLEMLFEDARSVEQQLDRIAGTLSERSTRHAWPSSPRRSRSASTSTSNGCSSRGPPRRRCATSAPSTTASASGSRCW